jgi:hypothetical protein
MRTSPHACVQKTDSDSRSNDPGTSPQVLSTTGVGPGVHQVAASGTEPAPVVTTAWGRSTSGLRQGSLRVLLDQSAAKLKASSASLARAAIRTLSVAVNYNHLVRFDELGARGRREGGGGEGGMAGVRGRWGLCMCGHALARGHCHSPGRGPMP